MSQTQLLINVWVVRRVRTDLTMVVLGTCFLVLLVFASSAFATRGRVFGGSFGSPGSGAGQLSLAPAVLSAGGESVRNAGSGLGVSQATHDVYVADTGDHRVDQFTSNGVFVRAWGWGVSDGAAEPQTCTSVCQQGLPGTAPGQFESPVFVAVDNSGGPSSGDVYVSDGRGSSDGAVQKFTSEGALVGSWGIKGQVIPSPKYIAGIAVDTAGNLWVATENVLFEFNQAGILVQELVREFAEGVGLAFNGTNDLYAVPSFKIVSLVNTGSGESFRYLLHPQAAVTGLAVNSVTDEIYVDEGKLIVVMPPSCVPRLPVQTPPFCTPSGSIGGAQLSSGGGVGLAVDSVSASVYAADATLDRVDVFVLEPPSAPMVERESVSQVTSSEATLEAEIDPRGAATTYRFDYGPCATRTTCASSPFDASVPVPDALAGSDFEIHSVSALARNLVSNTYYHYRVVASNEIGGEIKTASGQEGTFTTQSTGSFALPDGRAWELVSPPNKHGASLLPIFDGMIKASVTGDAISYLASAPTEGEPAGNPYLTQVLSRRTAGDWQSQDISVSHESSIGAAVGHGYEYRAFSSDLSLAVVQPFGPFDPRLSSEASEQTAFLRTNYSNGDVEEPCAASCYRPLVTGAPGFENVRPGTVFGCTGLLECGPLFVGASPDLRHIVLQSGAALTEGAPLGGESLYEWSAGSLVLVSVLPNRQSAPPASRPRFGEGQTGRNAVSVDGSRVVWSDNQEHLYVRDTVRGETVQVGSGPVSFQSASSDDSKILFTEEIGQNGQSQDLRECDIVESGGELHCEVTDLTPVGAGETPGVKGLIPGASADAAYVYFVANAALENNGVVVPGAQPGNCREQEVADGTCNLYVRHEGTIKLIAELSSEDSPDWDRLVALIARVSPGGRWLEFMSDRSLTGYDNRDVVTGRPDEEVYLYDASANGGGGRLACASCDPTGARPHGATAYHLTPIEGGISVGIFGFKADQGIAANVPGWIQNNFHETEFYQPRYLSDSGRLFFNSSAALVPQDSNGTGDVYEYEPENVGDCTSSSARFSRTSDGCVGLISSGTSSEESAFLDASENGNDVFFLTHAQLSHRDTDSIGDVYDARVSGGFPEAEAPPVCEGDACQSPVSAPEDQTPGSLTYSGPGNPSAPTTVTVAGKQKAKASRARKLARALVVCRRIRSRHVRTECSKRARKRYGGSKAGVTARKGAR